MKCTFKFIGFLGVILSAAVNAGAATLNPANTKIVLREFSVDATQTAVRSTVHCSQAEIEKGQWNLISFSSDTDNSERELVPTYHPLQNQAAWFINNQECVGLAPYLNGIGFAAFDMNTGNAVIYLAGFSAKPIDQDKFQDGNTVTRLALMFRPEFDISNVIKFAANCALDYSKLSAKLRLSDPEFVCTLSESKGSVRFAVKKQ